MNFLKKGFAKDPKKRPSAAEMLNDPWILNADHHQEHKLDKAQMTEIFRNLRKFEKKTNFQKTITSILISLVGDQEELKILRQAFEEIDKNHDGVIEPQEILALDVEHKWRDVLENLQKVDLRNEGAISYQDFLAAAIDQEKLMTDENIKIAFDLFDQDKNGKIDVNEFKYLISKTENPVEHSSKYKKPR